jgi:CheY-like chemotaxis protein
MAAILIVEDEAQVRVLSESYLQNQGHATLSAANIDEALAVLQASKEVDLLFTDIGLQGDKPYTIDQLQTVLTVNFGIKPHPRSDTRP